MPVKVASLIVKMRWWIVGVFAILTLVCALMIDRATINYDFTAYLSDDTVTRQSLNIMNAEFGATEQLTVMFEDLAEGEAAKLAEELGALEGVLRASFDPDADSRTVNGVRCERVNLFLNAKDTVAFTRALSSRLSAREGVGTFFLSGAAASTLSVQENIAREIPVAMLIALAVVACVLLLTSHSYVEPVVFFIVLAVSIIVNMGTNWVFDSISFVTFAVSAILQLALAMDYSIMLLHNYFDLQSAGMRDRDALVQALARSFMPVASSALTTVAGLAALMFMSFTIGYDIGIVLSKGILISMLTVFTLMPSLVLLFSKSLRRTMHKPLPLGGEYIGRFVMKTRRVLPALLVLVIAFSAYLQTRNEYAFTDQGSNAQAKRVSEVFGESNPLVLLFPKGTTDADYDTQRELLRRLNEMECEGHPAVASAASMVTTGAEALKFVTANDIADIMEINPWLASVYFGAMGFTTRARADQLLDKAAEFMPQNEKIMELKGTLDFARGMFEGENYSRAILLLNVPYSGEAVYRVIDEIQGILADLYPGASTGIAGTAMSSYDISSAFDTDILRVNLITIAAILSIILISFRSVSVPVILTCVIQGAIWITMAISAAIGERIFFMCYLICTAIQMGATIDYGILLTSHYRRLRLTQAPREALCSAMELSLPTIFTSGIILTVAGFAIGRACTVYYIYSIGRMLARGAAVSVALVLVLLPALLVNLDKAVVRGVKGVHHEPDAS